MKQAQAQAQTRLVLWLPYIEQVLWLSYVEHVTVRAPVDDLATLLHQAQHGWNTMTSHSSCQQM
jgi:hypothetical protein